MRAFNRTLSLISLFGLSLAVSACGKDISGKVACTETSACIAQAGSLFPDGVDGGDRQLPACCGGFCVVPSGGCGNGYRYLTSEPAYGACVAEDPMCPALPDMSQPEEPGDMATSSTD